MVAAIGFPNCFHVNILDFFIKIMMLFLSDAMISAISVVSILSRRVILDWISTWYLDTMTSKRQIPEHTFPFIMFDF